MQIAKEFKGAMLFNGGLNGVQVALVGAGTEGKCVLPEVKLA